MPRMPILGALPERGRQPYDGRAMPRKPNESSKAFGKLLRKARNDAGLTTEQLSKQLYCARETADRWMRGERRPNRDVVVRWEELCGLHPGTLLDAYDALPPARRRQLDPGTDELPPQAPPPSDQLPGDRPDPKQTRDGPPNLEQAPDAPPLAKRLDDTGPESAEPRPRRLVRVIALLVAAAAVLALAGAGFVVGGALRHDDESSGAKPNPRYAARLHALVSRLSHVRLVQRSKLNTEAKPDGQAAAALQIRKAFATAIGEGRRLPVSDYERAATSDLLDALARAHDAYGDVAKAASGDAEAEFDAASDRVAQAERDLQSAVASLAKLGYEPDLSA